MADAAEVLRSTNAVLIVDWPSRDVPDTLARAGFVVTVHAGPGPEDYSAYELDKGEVVVRHLGAAPAHVDLVYAHRPVEELPHIISTARAVGATTIWLQSGLANDGTRDPTGCWLPERESGEARTLVEAAGLVYLDEPYIAAAIRGIQRGRTETVVEP